MAKEIDAKLMRLNSSKSETNLSQNTLSSYTNEISGLQSAKNVFNETNNRLQRLDVIDLNSKELDVLQSNGVESVNIKNTTILPKHSISADNVSQASIQSKDTNTSIKSNGLSPIPVSEARTKNYIVGSVNHQVVNTYVLLQFV